MKSTSATAVFVLAMAAALPAVDRETYKLTAHALAGVVGQMGLADRMAGDRAIGLGVVELSNEATTFARMAEVAAELRDEDGADVLVMGCAGMARYRDRLQRHVGLPVVEPSQAAVAMAIGRSRLGWSA